jgi:Spy/CpxP family protein refolding chaperone
MNQICLLAIGSVLLFAPAAMAQQTPAQPGSPVKGAAQDVDLPRVEDQLKVLTQKLNLIDDQQAKIKPILQELHDASLKLMQDKSMSHEDLLSKVRPLRMNADKKIREILSDDQKKKLDQYLQGPHSEMHGNLSGATPPVTGKPKL